MDICMSRFVHAFSKRSARVAHSFAIILLLLSLVLLSVAASARILLARMAPRLRPMLQHTLHDSLGRAVEVGSIRLHGIDTLVIANTRIANGATFAGGTALTIPKTLARVNLLSLLFHHANPAGAIDTITLTDPSLTVRRTAAGAWNFQDVIDRLRRHPATTSAQPDVRVVGGDVSYRDARGFGATPRAVNQHMVRVRGRLLASRGGYVFRVSGEDARRQTGRIELAGIYAPEQGSTRLQVNAARVQVRTLSDYLPKNLPITFQDGTAALRLSALVTNLPTAAQAGRIPSTALTAEVDMSGVGLRLRELNTPIVATSGRLRLVHDAKLFPNGSRLELINVQARAGDVPLRLYGALRDLNLLDLAHANPYFDVHTLLATDDGAAITRLFPQDAAVRNLLLHGPVTVDGRITGRHTDLHIDGRLQGARVAMHGVNASGIQADFHLRPGITSAPSVQLHARLDHASWNDSRMRQVTVNMSTATPWRHLDDSLQLAGTVTAAAVDTPWVATSNLQADIVTSQREITLTDLRATLFGGHTVAAVTLPLDGHPVQVAATLQNADLAAITGALHVPGVTGRVSGDVTLSAGHELMLTARLTGADARYHGYTAHTLTANLDAMRTGDLLTVRIARARVRSSAGDFTLTDGLYQRETAAPHIASFSAAVHGEAIPLKQFSEKQFTGIATLDGQLTGSPFAPTLHAQVAARDGSLLGHGFATARGEMTLRAGDLRFRNLVFDRAGMHIEIPGGPEGFDPRQGMAGLDAVLTLNGAPLDDVLGLFNQHSPWPVSGGTDGTITLHVTDHGVTATGEGIIPGAVVRLPLHGGDYPLHLDRIALQFDYVDRVLQVRNLRLQRGNSVIVASGTAGCPDGSPLRADLTFHDDGLRLEDMPTDLVRLPLDLTGAAMVSGDLHGVLNGSGDTPLALTAAVRVPELRADDLPLGAGKADIAYSYRPGDARLDVRAASLVNAAFTATAGGGYRIDNGTLDDVRVSLDHLDLAALPKVIDVDFPIALRGTGHAVLTASGSVKTPTLHGEMTLNHAGYGTVVLPNLRAAVDGLPVKGRYQVRLTEAAATTADGRTLARVAGSLYDRGKMNLAFSADGLTTDTLAPWIGSHAVAGTADLHGTLAGSWHNPVLETDIAMAQPAYAGHQLERIAGHLTVTRNAAVLRDATLTLLPGAAPVSVAARVPLVWNGMTPDVARTQPFSLQVTIPRQNLAALRALAPALTAVDGTMEASIQVDGTPAQPRISQGRLLLAGTTGLPVKADAYADRLRDMHVDLRFTGDRAGMTLTIDRLSATLDRARHARGFQPGWVTAAGTVRIPAAALLDPQAWTWDVYANLIRIPLSAQTFLVPNASAYLHLGSADGAPTLTGVTLVSGISLKQPKLDASALAQWGPFPLNPRLSLVVQVGQYVRLIKGIIHLPLQPTPLDPPVMPTLTAGAPSLDIDRDLPAYDYSAAMLHPETASEMTGTWGTVTGTLDNPKLYARFEVEKKRLRFPMSLFGAVRHAKGHVTYTRADGPKLVMGIPDFPMQAAAKP
jgi:hypothetical protein